MSLTFPTRPCGCSTLHRLLLPNSRNMGLVILGLAAALTGAYGWTALPPGDMPAASTLLAATALAVFAMVGSCPSGHRRGGPGGRADAGR